METWKPTAPEKAPRRVSVQQQLWELTNERQHDCIRQAFRRIKKRDQMDLCYGLIAYIRFGIRRPYPCSFMQTLFEGFVELIDHQNDDDNDTSKALR